MHECEIQAKKIKILESIAEKGAGCEQILVTHYRYDPNDSSNAAMRTAIAQMVFEQVGSFARQMMVRVIGSEGGIADTERLSLLLDSTERADFDYDLKKFAECEGRAHASDSDEEVRKAAVEAIGRIISREAGGNSAPVNGSLGERVANCALLDDSKKVRGMAAEILWNYADRNAILALLKEFSDAEANGNRYICARAEEAIKKAADAMKKGGVRETAAVPLIETALEGGKQGILASDLVVRLAGMGDEVGHWLKKERASIGTSPALEGEEKAKKLRRINALIGRIGVVSGKEELPLPGKLAGKELDGTRKGKKPGAREEDEDLIRIPRGPVVELFRKVGDTLRGRKIKIKALAKS